MLEVGERRLVQSRVVEARDVRGDEEDRAGVAVEHSDRRGAVGDRGVE